MRQLRNHRLLGQFIFQEEQAELELELQNAETDLLEDQVVFWTLNQDRNITDDHEKWLENYANNSNLDIVFAEMETEDTADDLLINDSDSNS